jgi:non-ribosomal peptide synthetase component F
VGPEVLVGICVERGPEMVVGLFAILKAGGAYVPLDPGYPLERLDFMLENAGVTVLLTQERLEERLPSHGAIVVYLDQDRNPSISESEMDLPNQVGEQNLAYMLYTSGSTGVPKA